MRRRLKTPGHMMGDGVARVFLRALVQLIGGYRVALRMCPGEQITFCRDALLNSRPPALRPFLESMLQLQIFQQFIEERLEMLNSGQVILFGIINHNHNQSIILTVTNLGFDLFLNRLCRAFRMNLS